MISEEVRWIPYSVFNSFIAAAAVMFIVLVLGSLASYAYARLRFPAGGAPSVHPAEPPDPHLSLAMPYYAIVQSLGLLNTRWALIGIYTVLTLPFAVRADALLQEHPEEIDEAARVEATPLQNLWYITLPLALPGLIGAGLFTFMLAYSEFLLALLITNTRIARTVPVTLGSISTNPDVSWGCSWRAS